MSGRAMDVFTSDRTYVVGVGAQKAGTSWLYDYLASRPDTFMSPIKELHYFDAEFRPDWFAARHKQFVIKAEQVLKLVLEKSAREHVEDWASEYLATRSSVLSVPKQAGFEHSDFPFQRRVHFQKTLHDLLQTHSRARRSGEAAPSATRKPRNEKLFDRLENTMDRAVMAFDPDGYAAYFNRRVQQEHVIFGEVTPSYALLDQVGFAQIRKMSSRTKVIFLLRDPVDRFYSMLRMRERRQGDYDIAESFRRELADPKFVALGAYRQTFEELMKVFSPKDVHIDFYETLFQDDSLRALCEFLSVPFIPGQYKQRVGAAPTPPKPMPAGLRDEARQAFSDTYAFAKGEFGSRVPAKWLV